MRRASDARLGWCGNLVGRVCDLQWWLAVCGVPCACVMWWCRCGLRWQRALAMHMAAVMPLCSCVYHFPCVTLHLRQLPAFQQA